MAENTLVVEKTGELRMDAAAKEERYREVAASIEAVIGPERDLLASMATMVCLLHNAFPYYFWTGFYRRVGPTRLLVGPYQGTNSGTTCMSRVTRPLDASCGSADSRFTIAYVRVLISHRPTTFQSTGLPW